MRSDIVVGEAQHIDRLESGEVGKRPRGADRQDRSVGIAEIARKPSCQFLTGDSQQACALVHRAGVLHPRAQRGGHQMVGREREQADQQRDLAASTADRVEHDRECDRQRRHRCREEPELHPIAPDPQRIERPQGAGRHERHEEPVLPQRGAERAEAADQQRRAEADRGHRKVDQPHEEHLHARAAGLRCQRVGQQ